MVQSILSSLNADEVNSIGDTPESLQVAECVKVSYLNMQGRYDLPEHNQPIQLDPSTDPTMPVLMFKPQGVNRIEELWYYDSNPQDGSQTQTDQFGAFSHDLNTDIVNSNTWTTTSTTSATIQAGVVTFTVSANIPNVLPNAPVTCTAILSPSNTMSGVVVGYIGTQLTLSINSISGSGTFNSWSIQSPAVITQAAPGYKEVKLLTIKDFIRMTNSFNLNDSDVGFYNLTVPQNSNNLPQSFIIKYRNDKQPQYWTVMSNHFILFDSFDNTQDSTLQSSKTLGYGWVVPAFLMEDNFTPDLDEAQFPMLLQEAKSLAFLEIKQTVHPKAEKEVMRQLSSLQKFKFTAHRPDPIDELRNFGRMPGRY